MNTLDDTLRLIQSWRAYRALEGEDRRYARLVADFALIIRRRIERYGTAS